MLAVSLIKRALVPHVGLSEGIADALEWLRADYRAPRKLSCGQGPLEQAGFPEQSRKLCRFVRQVIVSQA